MKRLHVIGRKNHGKTSLIVELVESLSLRHLVIGTIKHTHHQHELDVPGKDSHRHRLAGARVVGIASPTMSAVFMPSGPPSNGETDRYELLAPLFSECDLVLVEGEVSTTAPKIEVWRSELGAPPLAAADNSILAVVSDDVRTVPAKVLPRADITQLIDWICEKMLLGS